MAPGAGVMPAIRPEDSSLRLGCASPQRENPAISGRLRAGMRGRLDRNTHSSVAITALTEVPDHPPRRREPSHRLPRQGILQPPELRLRRRGHARPGEGVPGSRVDLRVASVCALERQRGQEGPSRVPRDLVFAIALLLSSAPPWSQITSWRFALARARRRFLAFERERRRAAAHAGWKAGRVEPVTEHKARGVTK